MIGKAIKMDKIPAFLDDFDDYLFTGLFLTILLPFMLIGVAVLSPVIFIGYTFCKIMDTLDKPLF